MLDVAIAELLAALLKTLSEADPTFRERFEKHRQQMTLDDLLDALKIVKGIRHDDLPSDRQLREEIDLFLAAYRS